MTGNGAGIAETTWVGERANLKLALIAESLIQLGRMGS